MDHTPSNNGENRLIRIPLTETKPIGIFGMMKDTWVDTHALKTVNPEYYAVLAGRKTFELRKNDRNFKVGDRVVLMEWENNQLTRMQKLSNWIAARFPFCVYYPEGNYTGRQITAKISYVLRGGKWGLRNGYVILQLENIEI